MSNQSAITEPTFLEDSVQTNRKLDFDSNSISDNDCCYNSDGERECDCVSSCNCENDYIDEYHSEYYPYTDNEDEYIQNEADEESEDSEYDYDKNYDKCVHGYCTEDKIIWRNVAPGIPYLVEITYTFCLGHKCLQCFRKSVPGYRTCVHHTCNIKGCIQICFTDHSYCSRHSCSGYLDDGSFCLEKCVITGYCSEHVPKMMIWGM